MLFKDIPQLTRAHYQVNVNWAYLEGHIAHAQDPKYVEEGMAVLDLEPDFQRAHVWNEAQQSSYVEWILKGGESGKELLFNCTGWSGSYEGPYVLVDGLQRLTAVRKFMRNELKAFGHTLEELGGVKAMRMTRCDFLWRVASLDTRAEVLQWYLQVNSGGVVHTSDELDRVREMLKKEKSNKK